MVKLVKWDVNNVAKPNGFRRTPNQKLIEDFANSAMDCAKVEGFTQKDAMVCAASLNVSIKNMRKSGIRAISRRGEVFLIKEEAK